MSNLKDRAGGLRFGGGGVAVDLSGGRFHWLSPLGRFSATRLAEIRRAARERWIARLRAKRGTNAS